MFPEDIMPPKGFISRKMELCSNCWGQMWNFMAKNSTDTNCKVMNQMKIGFPEVPGFKVVLK